MFDPFQALVSVSPMASLKARRSVPFAIAFPIYFHVHRAFHWQAVTASLELLSGQVLVIALPEEAFFRGFLQTELEPLFARRVRVLGADLSLAIPVASVNPSPSDLARV